jgi:hypothetical protein
MTAKLPAQGWYRDPYGLHHDRYFSAGTATALVRDDGRESHDPLPDEPLPDGDLVPAEEAGACAPYGTDLRRADQLNSDVYDPAQAKRAAFDVFDRSTNR